jgi:hypothetical protein
LSAASAPVSTGVRFGPNSPYLEASRKLQCWQLAAMFQTHAIHGFDFTVRRLRTNRQPKSQTAKAAWFSPAQPRE